MRFVRLPLIALAVMLLVPSTHAQDKLAPPPEPRSPSLQIPLKVQFVLNEDDGAKKIASMPYTMSLTVSHPDKRDGMGSLRVGVRVPVVSSSGDGPNNMQYQYVDIGTNIDCWVWQWTEGRYLVAGRVELSSLYARNSLGETKEVAPGDANLGPLIRQTRGDFSIALHDGQSGEPISLTDPITGHFFKLEVTLNLVKYHSR